MEKKLSALAVLFAVVLLTLAFSPLSGQQGSNYDPWLDFDGDGKIDVNDLREMAQTYGGSGDSTKNVNVTNFPLDNQGNIRVATRGSVLTVFRDQEFSVPFQVEVTYLSGVIEVDGFSEFYVYTSVSNWFSQGWTLYCEPVGITDGIEAVIPKESGTNSVYAPNAYDGIPRNVTARYLIWSPEIKIRLKISGAMGGPYSMPVSVSLYLRK